jgi:hypothetical protein
MKSLVTALVAFGLLFAFSAPVLASETRVETMGMGTLYVYNYPLQSPNSIIKDEYNIGMYPASINSYSNFFFAEISRMNDSDPSGYGFPGMFYKAGAIFKLGSEEKPWYLGAHFSSMPYFHNLYGFSNYFWNGGATHKLNLYYGRKLGDMPFGFNFGYYGSGNKNEDTTTALNYENSLTRFEFGFGLSVLEEKLDLAVEYAMTSWKDDDYYAGPDEVVEDTKPSGNADLIFRARYWMDPMGKYTLVPHFAFMMLNEGMEDYAWNAANSAWELVYEEKFNNTVFDLGIGVNYDASENVLVATDVGFAMVNSKSETDYTDVAIDDEEDKDDYRGLPYFRLGIDAYVFKWLDFRAGVVSASINYNIKEQNDTIDRTYSWTTTETFLGAGLNWGSFMIDLSLDPEFILEGPNFLSGENTDDAYDGLAAKASLTYWFE